jgi:hypothetical protein
VNAETAQSMLEMAESTRPKFRGSEAKAAVGHLEERYRELLAAIEESYRHGARSGRAGANCAAVGRRDGAAALPRGDR